MTNHQLKTQCYLSCVYKSHNPLLRTIHHLEPKRSVSMERSINSRTGGVVVIFLILVLASSAVTSDRIYSCWGGCYNQCYPNVQNQSEKFPCYYKCLNGCFPPTAADFQYYCQIGCSLKRCIPVSSGNSL